MHATLQLLGMYRWSRRRTIKGLIGIPYTTFFELAADSSTRGHSLKILKPHCKTDVRKFFFSYKVINRWNRLPEDSIHVNSINSFKEHLQKIYSMN